MMPQASPAKRARLEAIRNQDVLEIVSAIQETVTTTQRLDVLRRLFNWLGYHASTRIYRCDPGLVQLLVRSGVIQALQAQLMLVMHRHGATKEEVAYLCMALDLFYRVSSETCDEKSLQETNPDFFVVLPRALQRGAVLPVLSIWHSCSSSAFGTSLLLRDKHLLQQVTSAFPSQNYDEQALNELLGLLKNITYFDEACRRRVMEQPGLVEFLTSTTGGGLKIDERLSAVFRNLALSCHTRPMLAQRSDILNALIRMTNIDSKSTRRNVLNTFVSLAMDADACLLIVFHGDGMLVDFLKRYAVFEEDDVVRKRAIRTLRLFARDTLVQLMAQDRELMNILSHRALYDDNHEVRAEAAEAFARYAGLMKAAMPQHEAILEALSQLVSSPNVEPMVMAKALKEQSSYPENRAAIARKEKLLKALARIGAAPDSSKVTRETVCGTFLDLSLEQCNLGILATSPTLKSLVHNAGDRTEGHYQLREIAVRTLLHLAMVPQNRHRMAREFNLMQALLQFTSVTYSDSLKKEVKLVWGRHDGTMDRFMFGAQPGILRVMESYQSWKEDMNQNLERTRERQRLLAVQIKELLGDDEYKTLQQMTSALLEPEGDDDSDSDSESPLVTFVQDAVTLIRPKLTQIDIPPDVRETILLEIADGMENMHANRMTATKVNIESLKDDLKETFVRGSGRGGQNISKTSNRVMLVHISTNLRVECQDTRSIQQTARLPGNA
eukprot:Nitzschia sp. Nitz4//scaffold195_size40117//14151//16704//NITZ4_007575-RA/size40117-processed-gene-0.45-mRNA-1//-1//CDS//3329540362//1532//frame0